jgi:hypothetical protein
MQNFAPPPATPKCLIQNPALSPVPRVSDFLTPYYSFSVDNKIFHDSSFS